MISSVILAGCIGVASTAFADGVSLQFDTSQLPAELVGNTSIQYGGQYTVGNATLYANFNWLLINSEVVQLNTVNAPVSTDQIEFSLRPGLDFIVLDTPSSAYMYNAAQPQNPTCPQTLYGHPFSPGVSTLAFSAEPMQPLPGKSLYLPGYWIDCKVVN